MKAEIMKTEILEGVFEAIFFTESEELGDNTSLSIEASLKIANMVDEFITKATAGDLISQALDNDGYDFGRIGNDVWFTVNKHGTGFWDRGLGDIGQELTNICDDIREINVYIGDDGLIYCM